MCERSDAELREIFLQHLLDAPVKLERTYQDQEGDPLFDTCFVEKKPQQVENSLDFEEIHPQAEAHEIPEDFKMISSHSFDGNIPEIKGTRAKIRNIDRKGDRAKTSIDRSEKKDSHDGALSVVIK